MRNDQNSDHVSEHSCKDHKTKLKNYFRQLTTSKDIEIDESNDSVNNSMSELLQSYQSLNARIIGDESWAPVRDQLILNLTPRPKRAEQIQRQNFRCADCGIQIRKDNVKTFNFCEYFCKYFCRCCHINSQSFIPAKIIFQSDFAVTYGVSKKAKSFLDNIYTEPVIGLERLNPSLFENWSEFAKIKYLRLKLVDCKSYLNTCRFAVELKNSLYEQIDSFMINDPESYSIEILFRLKNSNYLEKLRNGVIQAIQHIKKCELCSQQGYLCGVCASKELIYPFEFEKVVKCPKCLACYHKKCFKEPHQCPLCKRKQNRKKATSGDSASLVV